MRSYNPSMDLDFGHEAFKFQGPRPHRLAMCHVGGLPVYFAGPKGHANASGLVGTETCCSMIVMIVTFCSS